MKVICQIEGFLRGKSLLDCLICIKLKHNWLIIQFLLSKSDADVGRCLQFASCELWPVLCNCISVSSANGSLGSIHHLWCHLDPFVSNCLPPHNCTGLQSTNEYWWLQIKLIDDLSMTLSQLVECRSVNGRTFWNRGASTMFHFLLSTTSPWMPFLFGSR